MFWQPQADPKQLEPASSPRERQLRRSAEVVASQWAAGAPKSVGFADSHRTVLRRSEPVWECLVHAQCQTQKVTPNLSSAPHDHFMKLSKVGVRNEQETKYISSGASPEVHLLDTSLACRSLFTEIFCPARRHAERQTGRQGYTQIQFQTPKTLWNKLLRHEWKTLVTYLLLSYTYL